VTNDDDSLDTQQWRTSRFRVIDLCLKTLKGLSGKQCPNFRGKVLRQILLQKNGKHVGQSFTQFQCHIPDKTIADNNVHFALKDIPSFNISDKVDWRRLQ